MMTQPRGMLRRFLVELSRCHARKGQSLFGFEDTSPDQTPIVNVEFLALWSNGSRLYAVYDMGGGCIAAVGRHEEDRTHHVIFWTRQELQQPTWMPFYILPMGDSQ